VLGDAKGPEELFNRAERLIDDPEHEARIAAMAELATAMGDSDAATEIVNTGKRIRSQLRVALVAFKKGAVTNDVGMLESSKQSVLECLAQEEALALELSKALSAALFLIEEGNNARMHRFSFEAPSYLGSMVSMVKAEMKAKTGRSVQDYHAIRAALLYALVHADDFLNSSMVVGPSNALAHRGTRARSGKAEGGN
jgi:hypothetical protein